MIGDGFCNQGSESVLVISIEPCDLDELSSSGDLDEQPNCQSRQSNSTRFCGGAAEFHRSIFGETAESLRSKLRFENLASVLL